MLNLPYKTAQDAIVALGADYFPHLHALPYNRFDVKHSRHWGLIPGNDCSAWTNRLLAIAAALA